MSPFLPGESALRALFARGRDREVAQLAAVVKATRTADYFEILGVPRTCTADEARAAADARLAIVDRALAQAGATPDPVLADARQVVLDARDVLGDDALREAYRTGLTDG